MSRFTSFFSVAAANGLSSVLISPLRDDLSLLLWCLYLGVLAALLYLVYNKNKCAPFLSALLEKECFSEESAKGLSELGLKNRSAKKKKLNGPLLNTVFCTEKDGGAAYWIPPEKKEKARFAARGFRIRWWAALLTVAGFYAILVACYYLLPIITGKTF